MKLWRFSDPLDYRFARAGRVGGTWQEGEYKARKGILTIEWEKGPDLIGDFTWVGLVTDIAISIHAEKVLLDGCVVGFESRPVQVRGKVAGQRSRVGKSIEDRSSSKIALRDFWINQWRPMDRNLSTVEDVTQADGSHQIKLQGVQYVEGSWDRNTKTLVKLDHPRIPGKGLFVRDAVGVFRVEEFPAWVFCTDDVKELIEKSQLTNVSFLEMGDVLD
jgi:hypothetical protein